MYALCNKIQNNDSTRYHFLNEVSLFGCRKGYVPRLLSKQFSTSSAELVSVSDQVGSTKLLWSGLGGGRWNGKQQMMPLVCWH